MIELHWIVAVIDNMIVPVTGFQINLLNLALQIYLRAEISNWQAVTQNLGVGLLSDIFRISDFFWKLGGGIIIEHRPILGSLRYIVSKDALMIIEEQTCIFYQSFKPDLSPIWIFPRFDQRWLKYPVTDTCFVFFIHIIYSTYWSRHSPSS